MSSETKISVIGLGYVGLPLAATLAGRFPVVGFDINKERVSELRDGFDRTNEVRPETLRASGLRLTSDEREIADCTLFIVTVPTPVDEANEPDLKPLLSACKIVGSNLKKGSVVVFESTVYPGVTEDIADPRSKKLRA